MAGGMLCRTRSIFKCMNLVGVNRSPLRLTIDFQLLHCHLTPYANLCTWRVWRRRHPPPTVSSTHLPDVFQQYPLSEAHAVLQNLQYLLLRQFCHVHAVWAQRCVFTQVLYKPEYSGTIRFEYIETSRTGRPSVVFIWVSSIRSLGIVRECILHRNLFFIDIRMRRTKQNMTWFRF